MTSYLFLGSDSRRQSQIQSVSVGVAQPELCAAVSTVGSDILAPAGDINIVARKVDIIEARETSRTETETKFRQSGLTVAVSSPVISAIQTAQAMSQASKNTSSGRMQALAASRAQWASPRWIFVANWLTLNST